MRVSYMEPGRRAREERLVSREFPDYETDDRGEPSDAGAEEVRTYAAHRVVVAAALRVVALSAVAYCRGPALEQVPQRWRRQRLLFSTLKNELEMFKTQLLERIVVKSPFPRLVC